MAFHTIAILSPGDMGHAVGRVLGEHGHDIITCLAGRSKRTKALAGQGGFTDVADLEALTSAADLILSIIPPSAGLGTAEVVAAAMGRSGATPTYVDCNALSPATAGRIAEVIAGAGAPFIDASIIGPAPGKGRPTRFYVSGADTTPLETLDGKGIAVKPLGHEIGRASAMKMCYAGLGKATNALYAAVLMAAEAMGLSDELRAEFLYSKKDTYADMQANVSRLPADAGRWIGEMEEIAASFAAVGVTPNFHLGAADVFTMLASTPFAQETREDMDWTRTLEESVRVYVEQLPKSGD
jgi:3-hydroxyisobutyrate dehydrogenase-like beta-hydroxyacid dehydrogenase